MPYDKERQYYRLLFPPGDLAEFLVDGVKMHIHEASERGVRYEPSDGHVPEIDGRIHGFVVFKSVGQFEVWGRIDRRQAQTYVAILDPPGIPYAALMQEQLFLRRHYPDRFER